MDPGGGVVTKCPRLLGANAGKIGAQAGGSEGFRLDLLSGGVTMLVWTALACLPVPWESRTKAKQCL